MNWIQRFRAKLREKKRQRLLALIGRDIDRIARDAYDEGCYVTTKHMRAERLMEFQMLMAENKALRDRMLDIVGTQMPAMIFPTKTP